MFLLFAVIVLAVAVGIVFAKPIAAVALWLALMIAFFCVDGAVMVALAHLLVAIFPAIDGIVALALSGIATTAVLFLIVEFKLTKKSAPSESDEAPRQQAVNA